MRARGELALERLLRIARAPLPAQFFRKLLKLFLVRASVLQARSESVLWRARSGVRCICAGSAPGTLGKCLEGTLQVRSVTCWQRNLKNGVAV